MALTEEGNKPKIYLSHEQVPHISISVKEFVVDVIKYKGKKGNTLPLLMGKETCTATFEIIMEVSQKIGNLPSSTSPTHIPKGCSIIPKGHFPNYVYSSFIHNIQKLETTKCPNHSNEELIK